MRAPQTMIVGNPRTWVEIDLQACAHNIAWLKSQVGANVLLLPLVKGDAYGCGAAVVGKALLDNGADWLGTELVEEALELRRAGIDAPLLVLGPCEAQDAPEAAAAGLRVTVRDVETLEAICDQAARYGKLIRLHLELDTGLNRLGLGPGAAQALARQIVQSPSVALEGVWTHFASSEAEDPGFTHLQFERFQAFLAELEADGIEVPIRHAANSAALLRFAEMRLDLARCGETVYGLSPNPALLPGLDLRPVVTWKSRLIQTRRVTAGESAGYGQTWTAQTETLLGVAPVGYADGYRRSYSNRAAALVRGQPAPLAGRVSMHTIVVDLSQAPEAQVGDEVVLLGRQGQAEVSAYDLAAWAGTAEFEILLDISAHVPRIYSPPSQE